MPKPSLKCSTGPSPSIPLSSSHRNTGLGSNGSVCYLCLHLQYDRDGDGEQSPLRQYAQISVSPNTDQKMWRFHKFVIGSRYISNPHEMQRWDRLKTVELCGDTARLLLS